MYENVIQFSKQSCNDLGTWRAHKQRVGGGKVSIGPLSPFLPFYRFLYRGVVILLQIFPRGAPARPHLWCPHTDTQTNQAMTGTRYPSLS